MTFLRRPHIAQDRGGREEAQQDVWAIEAFEPAVKQVLILILDGV